jgi:hypothetical protein
VIRINGRLGVIPSPRLASLCVRLCCQLPAQLLVNVMNIKTNNQPRQPMSGLTLELFVGDKRAAEIRKQFDYLSDTEFEDESFIQYKGYVYALSLIHI